MFLLWIDRSAHRSRLATRSTAGANRDHWFNIYPQILNVALSRAKYLLYIVGDKQFCMEHSCEKKEECILKRIVKAYDELKIQGQSESFVLGEKVDSPTERFLLDKLLKVDFGKYGYKLVPKYVHKRYTLDFALIGTKKINFECDGSQHEIIKGLPILEDVERDEFLNKEGWTVLRFPNHLILNDLDLVINKLIASMKT
ncbi:MAG: DUF559 domain-containing protein [Candidatus Margulisiibacteriota bacterium]